MGNCCSTRDPTGSDLHENKEDRQQEYDHKESETHEHIHAEAQVKIAAELPF